MAIHVSLALAEGITRLIGIVISVFLREGIMMQDFIYAPAWPVSSCSKG
jgi:hypothetical protein